jgi:xanthine dehydrogenase large subunit
MSTSVLGQNAPHDSGRGHVSGKSIYIDDMPFQSNELLVGYFGSPVAHGKITSLDLTAAKLIPGVEGLFTYQDLNPHHRIFGPIIQDEVLLAEDTCMFQDQPIVVIAATSYEAILQAKKAIKITVEPLKPVFTIDEAKAKQDFIAPTRTIKRGEPEKAIEQAPHQLTGQFVNGGQDHFYLESQAAVVYPGEFDSLIVHSSTQSPTEVQHVVAELLGLAMNQVVCVTLRMGGGFGGKECQATHYAVMAALVAHKFKRPARMCLTKDDDMKITGKRHPFQNDYTVGFDANGRILGLKVHFYSDGGAYADLSTSIMGRALCHVENAYYIAHVEASGTVCRTNYPPNTAFRGFGGPQGVVNMENIIEEIACYLKKDPLEIRRMNLYGTEDRNITPYDQVFRYNKLPMMLERILESSQYLQKRQAVSTFNAHSQTHLKGLSLTPVKFGLSFNTKFLNQANALVNIYLDGTIQVSTGATEMGQGVNTKIRQIVADAFTLPLESVRVMATSTEKNNNTSATAASSGSDLNGSAALDACNKIKARLLKYAATVFAKPHEGLIPSVAHTVLENGMFLDTRTTQEPIAFQEMVVKAYRDRVSLGERGMYITQGVDFNWESGKGNPFLYFTTGWACAEVTIDRLTGELKVDAVDILMDIGRSINPGIDRGQITGAFIQGMGWVTNEELKYADDGTLLSHSPTTYKIPNIQDTPEHFVIDWVDHTDNSLNLKGSKGIGEPPLMLATSVWCAVKNALSYVGDRSIPKLNLPATGEEILLRLTERGAASPVTAR